MATIQSVVADTKLAATVQFAGPEASGEQKLLTALEPTAKTYTSSSTPPVTLFLAESIATTTTLDLTDFTDIEGAAKDGDGLQVQELRVQADSENTANVTIGPGDSDGYDMFGGDADVELPPGGILHMRFNDGLADIGTTSGVDATDVKVAVGASDSCTIEMAIG